MSKMHPPGGTKQVPPGQLALVAQAWPVSVQMPALSEPIVVNAALRAAPAGLAAVRAKRCGALIPITSGAAKPCSAMRTL
jgi:hypothetical protein